jgi:hypothetical protein
MCLGTWSKNYWADRENVFKSNFFGSEKFQVSCTFAVIQTLDNIGSLPFFSWAISMKLSNYYFSCPSTNVPSFVEKYPKIKYAFLTGPIGGNWTFVCETSFLLLNGSH